MAFDPTLDIEPLDYNFDTLAQRHPGKYPDLEGVVGTIPEPSDETVQRFQQRARKVATDVIPDGVDTSDRVALAKAMSALPEGTFAKIDGALIDAVAELCDGSPTRDQIAALPFRFRRKFIQWLQRELMDPEGSNAASSA